MRWLLYFIVAIGAVTGKRQQHYEQLDEKNDSSNHERVLLQNVFALDKESTLTEEKQLGFGQGSTRQGFKKGMDSVSDSGNGMGQKGGMGNMGVGGMGNMGVGGMGNMGVGGMQNLGGMATMGNRTMKMVMMVISTFQLLVATISVLHLTFLSWTIDVVFRNFGSVDPDIKLVAITFAVPYE